MHRRACRPCPCVRTRDLADLASLSGAEPSGAPRDYTILKDGDTCYGDTYHGSTYYAVQEDLAKAGTKEATRSKAQARRDASLRYAKLVNELSDAGGSRSMLRPPPLGCTSPLGMHLPSWDTPPLLGYTSPLGIHLPS